MSGSGACRDNLDSWLDDAEIDAPAPQETPAPQELLPCPFCGATATRGMFNVWCDACQASTACDSDATTEQIIASWNNRAEPPRNTQEVSEVAPEGENQSSAKSEPVVAAPETIRISPPALRALLFEALDDGDVPGGSDWLFYHWNTEIANDQRERFVDIVCEKYQKRLRQLPARG